MSLTKPGHFYYLYDFPGAFNYVKENGIQKEMHRPYIGCSQAVPKCFRDPFQCTHIKDFFSLGSIENVVKQFLHQPVGAHLALYLPDFELHHKEIYLAPTMEESTFFGLHAVSLIDGGTTKDGENYLLARLSNGPKYGDDGYVKVSVDTWARLINPDRFSNTIEKKFFSTYWRILFSFVCPILLSAVEEETIRK